jgi:hypothetical protein
MFTQGALLGGRTTTTSAIVTRPHILGAIVCGFHWDSDLPESLYQATQAAALRRADLGARTDYDVDLGSAYSTHAYDTDTVSHAGHH